MSPSTESSPPRVEPTVGRWAERSTIVSLVLTAIGLAAVAVLASLQVPTVTTDSAGNPVTHYNWLSLLPAAVTIAIAFATRQVLLALFLGIVSGGIVFGFGSGVGIGDFAAFPWSRINIPETFFLAELGTRDYAIILFVYLWMLGGLVGLWTKTGGAVHFAAVAGRAFVRGPRTAKVFAWIIGVIFHQGGTISTVLAGTTVRPLLDKHKISKEEAAYLVDSTASPVATIVPFNAWPIFVGGIVAGTIPFFQDANGAPDGDKAIAFFFTSLPYNFYAWFAVGMTLLMALGVLPTVLGMRKARRRVEETGQLVRPGSEPLTSKELSEVQVIEGYRTGLADFVLPIVFLLTIAIGPYMIQRALGRPTTVYIAEAFFTALLVAVVVALVKGMPLRRVLNGVIDGAKGVTMAAIVLGLAITLKGVAEALGTGFYVADLLSDLDASLLPFLLLVSGMVIAFSTGTSWGTFTVLFPVAMVVADAILPNDPTFLSVCFGAVISGSVFGDQASPISDTTILSSLAVGCDLMDHVTTQLPYAAFAAGLAGVLYLAIGFVSF